MGFNSAFKGLTLVSDLRCVTLHRRAAVSYIVTDYFSGYRDS